ncbi:unnamed protein product, partial [marine sediment metagenome]
RFSDSPVTSQLSNVATQRAVLNHRDTTHRVSTIEIASLAFGKLAIKKMDSHLHGNDIKNRRVG